MTRGPSPSAGAAGEASLPLSSLERGRLTSGARVRTTPRVVAPWILALSFLLVPAVAGAGNPLESVDTTSPRATLGSFLALTDEAARRYAGYRASPSPASQEAFWQLSSRMERLFDLSQIAPSARRKVADETFYMLWEVIARVDLPDLAAVPGPPGDQEDIGGKTLPSRWRLPGTEITMARVEEGVRKGDFLFTPDTVQQAPSYYEAVRGLPLLRPMPIENVYRINQLMTGWMIPMAWVEALPDWANSPVLGQVLWKWLALLLIAALAAGAPIALYHWARRKAWDGSLRCYLRHLGTPLAVLGFGFLFWYLAREQINLTGAAADVPDLLLEIAKGIAGIWGILLTARWLAAALVASPRQISLLRLMLRFVGFLLMVAVAFRTAHNLGVPVYGLIAGAGVGGLGIALAARSTLENFLGTLNLYADRPVHVGDFCRYGEDPSSSWLRIGTVEEIGLRSTRIRGIDRTITTIPNAEFSDMHIVNLTERERILFNTKLALRYETTADQLRLVLVKIREMLVAHPRVTLAPSRVRAVGFGEYSLNLEIFAYVDTSDWNEFLAVQEDLVLRIMEIVREAGTAFAVPSRVLYHGRDSRPGREAQAAAEAQVREWTATRNLPFPDFSPEYRKQIRNTLDYPPEGSVSSQEG